MERTSVESSHLSSVPPLRLGRADDAAEAEADAMASALVSTRSVGAGHSVPRRCCGTGDVDEVRRSADASASAVAEVAPTTADRIGRSRSAGASLPRSERSFFEPRLGRDLSSVRLHTGPEASELASSLGARAFTTGSDIFFRSGEYRPQSPDGRRLLAHELVHVAQHDGATGPVHRAIELRPPGRGEASAFDRRDELVDRLNTVSAAVTYRLDADGRTLLYDIDDATAMTEFDRKMTGFIDEAQVIPFRLITSAGRVRGAAGTFEPLTADSFITAYVDLDDLLGSSDIGFQLLLVHFVTERLQVRDYARKIGSVAALAPLFQRAHERGRDAEAELLQDLLGDPSIEHHYDELKPNQTTFVRAFRSVDRGYRVFWVIRGHAQRAVISITDIRVVDGTRRLTLEDFIAERNAVAP